MIRSLSSPASILSTACLLGLAPVLSAGGSEYLKLLPNDGVAGDSFGSAVATDGARVAVGAPAADDLGASSGTAYVFDASTGAQLLELVPLDGAAGDRFGSSIAIDGGRVAVGAPLTDGAGADSGSVYVFDAASGLQLFELEAAGAAAGEQFGFAVALDGQTLVVGALGSARVFDVTTGLELHELVRVGASTTFGLSGYGEAVAIDSGRIVVGARTENGVSGFSGAAYVFDAATGDQLHRLIANNGTAWSFFGAAVGIEGNVIAIGAPEAYGGVGKHAGVAYVFNATTGEQVHYLWPSSDPDGGHVFAKFGSSAAVDDQSLFFGSEQNNVLPVSSAGAMYHYDSASGSQMAKMAASDPGSGDDFGGAIAAENGVVVVGSARDDDLGGDSGAAYVFAEGGTVTDMAGCTGNSATLEHVGGMAIAGQTLVFRMAGAQPGSSLAMLHASAAPAPGWPGCGIDMGSAGELLIDLGQGSLLQTTPLLSTTPWSGAPLEVQAVLPPGSGLIGVEVYFQGAFMAPWTPPAPRRRGVVQTGPKAPLPIPEPMRLSNALEVVIGGYL